jgi:hypothetical protein
MSTAAAAYQEGYDMPNRPYSIITNSREEDLEIELRRSEGLSYKNSRAFFLKRLHMRKLKYLDEMREQHNQSLN